MNDAGKPQSKAQPHLKKRTALLIFASCAGVAIFTAGIALILNIPQSPEPDYAKTASYAFNFITAGLEELSPTDLENLLWPSLKETYTKIDQSRDSDAQNRNGGMQEINTGCASCSGSCTGCTGAEAWYAYPSTIYPCTRSGNDLLVLVNKHYQLPSDYAPSDLVSIENTGISATKTGLVIRNIIATDLTALASAAAGQGIDLAVLSAYRSYETQQITYTYWVNYNGGNTDAADTISARPGHSQHQLGTAIDFTSSEIGDQLGQQFANSSAGQWTAQHAWEYGFALAYPAGWESTTGYSYEPWHFRYIGKENAAEWRASGEILEVWLRGEN